MSAAARIVAIIPAVLLASILLWFGVIGFARALDALPVRGVLDDLGRGVDVEPSRIAAAVKALQSARVEDGVWHKRLGQFALRGALSRGADAQTMRNGLQTAHRELAMGLSLAPSDAHAWLWLMHAEFLLNGYSPMAIQALGVSWRQSLYFAPLARAQADFGLLFWPILEARERESVRAQMTLFATSDFHTAVRLGRRRGAPAMTLIREALASQPERLRSIEQLVKRAPQDSQ